MYGNEEDIQNWKPGLIDLRCTPSQAPKQAVQQAPDKPSTTRMLEGFLEKDEKGPLYTQPKDGTKIHEAPPSHSKALMERERGLNQGEAFRPSCKPSQLLNLKGSSFQEKLMLTCS